MSKDLILDGDSDYATLGAPDTYTARVDGIGGSLLRAGDVNGVVKAMTEAQTLLGNALTLKGVRTDLTARLAQILADDGSLRNGTSFPSSPVPLVGDLFYRTDGAKTLYIYDGTAWKTMFEGGGGGSIDHGTLSGLADSDHAAHIDVDGSKDFTGEQQMEMATPRFRFKGTEANAVEYGIGEDGGLFYVWENTGTEGTPVWFARFSFNTTGAAFTLAGSSVTLPPITNGTHTHAAAGSGGILAGNGVTHQVSSFTDATIDTTKTPTGTTLDIVVPAGGKVLLVASAFVNVVTSGTASNVSMRIYRDGVNVGSVPLNSAGVNNADIAAPITTVDTPATGTRTYTVELISDTASVSTVTLTDIRLSAFTVA